MTAGLCYLKKEALIMMYAVSFGVILISFIYMFTCYTKMKALPEGTPRMVKLAEKIREGANIFMITEYKTIIIVVPVLAIIFSLFVDKTSGLSILVGALMSSMGCIFGMKISSYANVRTTNTALETRNIGETVKTALLGGSGAGIGVPAFGLFGLSVLIACFGLIDPNAIGTGFIANLPCNPSITRLTAYSFGCSLVAMFNRVAGGNYTKSADISADIVGKVGYGLKEDDHRNPSAIADNVGDLVNDISGNCSDLLESFIATVVAPMIIAATTGYFISTSEAFFAAACKFPLFVAVGGLFSAVIGMIFILLRKMGDEPAKELDLATYIVAGLTSLIGLAVAYFSFGNLTVPDTFMFGWISPWITMMLGIASGVAIGKITEYYTDTRFTSVREIAKYMYEGVAFGVTKGDAVGSRSCMLPMGIIGLALFISSKISGSYGFATAALGMLSFVGATVSIDAFGPIADNAGGIASACELDPEVREITDKLDAVGNTTAAIGKGFAIGSAAFATVSLITSYVGSYSSGAPTLNIADASVMFGALFGAALIEMFIAILSDNTIDAAYAMAEETKKQMPDIISGKKEPDCETLIRIATNRALSKMLVPSLIAVSAVVVGGFMVGPEAVGGLLIGSTLVAIPRAIFMGNSGGAFDNAKKFIESGEFKSFMMQSLSVAEINELIKNYVFNHPEYKGVGEDEMLEIIFGEKSEAHDNAVNGDTIGDTRKDVVGVALDIFIKMMSTTACLLAPVFVSVSLSWPICLGILVVLVVLFMAAKNFKTT